jgi:hypothetical protein
MIPIFGRQNPYVLTGSRVPSYRFRRSLNRYPLHRKESALALRIFILAITLALLPAHAQNTSSSALTDQLKQQYKLTRAGTDSAGAPMIQPGSVLVIQQDGILAVRQSSAATPASAFRDGKRHPPEGGVTPENHGRLLPVGAKVYVTKIDASMAKNTVTFKLLETEPPDVPKKETPYKAAVEFYFPKGYLTAAEPSQVADVVALVFTVEDQSKPAGDTDSAAAAPGQGLTNLDVIKLVQAKLPDSIILSKIKSTPGNFDTSPDALIKLKQAGASEAVLQAMMDAAVPPPGDAVSAQPANSNGPNCTDYDSCLKQGTDAFQASQWDAALAFLQKANELDSTKGTPWGYIGEVYVATGQYPQLSGAANQALRAGGTLSIQVCHLRSFQMCEQGTFNLSKSEISFVLPNGQKLFSAPPNRVASKGAFNDVNFGSFFVIQVAGKNYRFNFIALGVQCNIGDIALCADSGRDRQNVVANYVNQTIPKLASGSI